MVGITDGALGRHGRALGGKVIKNVAGYDLAKLLSGSFGTLGLILEVAVQAAPAPARTRHGGRRPATGPSCSAAAPRRSRTPRSRRSASTPPGRTAGARSWPASPAAAASDHAEAALALLSETGLEPALGEADDELWERQRAGQRSADGVVLRVAGLQTDLPRLAELADVTGATLVGRAGLGVSWLKLEGLSDADAAKAVGGAAGPPAPGACVVLDAPAAVRRELDVVGRARPGPPRARAAA